MEGARNIGPTAIRITPDLKNWIKKLSKENHRSMGSEINVILEKYRKKHDSKDA